MVKETKSVDLYTTGRQPSDNEFARISDWIRQDKKKKRRTKQEISTVPDSQATR